ncbi:MAG: NAD+ kinase [Acidimicrobiales bacterium]|jgi:NAD+ kinase
MTDPTDASATLGIVIHQHRPEVADLARRVLDWCDRHQARGRLPAADAALIGNPRLGATDADFATGLDLCVSIGGDGTMLRAVQLTVHEGVPVLGINAGQLGYLTEFDPDSLEDALTDWAAGLLHTQERMLLEVTVEGASGVSKSLALNEVVLAAATNTRAVAVDAAISGNHFTSYLADGVIVATPTGSTAYSLSAGGPIVEPEFEALVLTPVAPHMVFDRSLVLAPSTEVRLTVSGYRAGTVAVDGRAIVDLEPGGAIVCRAASQRAIFLVRGDRDFHTTLKEKFGLSDR